MVFQESETVELKEVVVDDIRKEIIAFANCDGGKLYIGVRDDGTVVGVDNPDRTALQISNMARNAIKPDITMFMHYGTIEESGKKIVAIDIQRGTDRPYYIAKKGMRPEGVYVRQGYSAVPATDTAIRHMIKETDGDRFEAMRSLNQELTFNAVKKAFEQRNVDFGVQQMRTLKIIDSDGLYSNLAMLLSDQCTHTIKVAVFQGTDQNREQCRNGQRTHGDISCCKEYNRKYNRSDQGDAHIQCEHETTGCRNAFAALKMHIKGIIVPENNAKSRDGLQNLRHITKSREQQISHNPNGKYCLQGIPKKDNIAGRFAQGSKGIGCSGIAAAVIADINSLE